MVIFYSYVNVYQRETNDDLIIWDDDPRWLEYVGLVSHQGDTEFKYLVRLPLQRFYPQMFCVFKIPTKFELGEDRTGFAADILHVLSYPCR